MIDTMTELALGDMPLTAFPMDRWAVFLPFQQPRSLNDRRNQWAEAKSRKDWREAAGWAVKAAAIPACELVAVRLGYYPKVERRHDPDNLVASLKPCVDALIDTGVVGDDTQDYVQRHWPWILHKLPDAPRGRFVLVVERLE